MADLAPCLREPARLVKKHNGTFSAGGWCRASGMAESDAQSLAVELRCYCYQIRSVLAMPKDQGRWEVIFR